MALQIGLGAGTALAQSGDSGSAFPSPVILMLVLGALSLAPFLLMMMTSFVKVSVVLSILRSAIGTQQIPPNQVITGLAFVLTLFIMTPVARDMYREAGIEGSGGRMMSEGTVRELFEGARRGREPLRTFLAQHAHAKDQGLFLELAQRMSQTEVEARSFQVLIPAFVISELKEAFQIGFVIFVPFLVIDMIVANILLSLGMMMLSPTVISLPFKLLLMVLVDGWYLIVKGLVLSYLPR